MLIRNTSQQYGWLAIALHWLVVPVILGLFALGLWMVDLTYYDTWYHKAPNLHKSIGVSLLVVMSLRLLWRLVNPAPEPLAAKSWEIRLAHLVHRLLYLLVFAIMTSGYLISTAKGQGISVFGWFEVPALLTGGSTQADLAGEIHLILAVSLMVLVALHALAALKHHFIERDRTLRRMLSTRKPE